MFKKGHRNREGEIERERERERNREREIMRWCQTGKMGLREVTQELGRNY